MLNFIKSLRSSGSRFIDALRSPTAQADEVEEIFGNHPMLTDQPSRSFPLAESIKPDVVTEQPDQGAQLVTGSMLQGSIDSSLSTGLTNFGNLENRGQPDALPVPGRFAKFASPLEGAEALARDINSKIQKNPAINLAQIISIYAPPGENNTKEYINNVASRLGVKPTTPVAEIAKSNLKNLIIAIGSEEGTFGNGPERKANIKKFGDAVLEYGLKGFGAGKQNL